MAAKGKPPITDAQKRRVITAKAAGLTDQAAAAVAGLGRTSVHKILSDPGNRSLLREIRFAHADELTQLYSSVIKTLAEELVSPDNVKNRARLREEALRFLAFGEQLGVGQAADGASGSAGMTLGDILVRFTASAPAGLPTASASSTPR